MAADERNGLDEVRRVFQSHDAPPVPICELLGMRLAALGDGEATWELEPSTQHLNPYGSAHGAVFAALLDSAMAVAAFASLPPGVQVRTNDLHIYFVRPLVPGSGVARAHGVVVHRGRTLVTSEARLHDGAGRLCAHGTASFIVTPTTSPTPVDQPQR